MRSSRTVPPLRWCARGRRGSGAVGSHEDFSFVEQCAHRVGVVRGVAVAQHEPLTGLPVRARVVVLWRWLMPEVPGVSPAAVAEVGAAEAPHATPERLA